MSETTYCEKCNRAVNEAAGLWHAPHAVPERPDPTLHGMPLHPYVPCTHSGCGYVGLSGKKCANPPLDSHGVPERPEGGAGPRLPGQVLDCEEHSFIPETVRQAETKHCVHCGGSRPIAVPEPPAGQGAAVTAAQPGGPGGDWWIHLTSPSVSGRAASFNVGRPGPIAASVLRALVAAQCGWCGRQQHRPGEHCERCTILGAHGQMGCDCGAGEVEMTAGQGAGRPELRRLHDLLADAVGAINPEGWPELVDRINAELEPCDDGTGLCGPLPSTAAQPVEQAALSKCMHPTGWHRYAEDAVACYMNTPSSAPEPRSAGAAPETYADHPELFDDMPPATTDGGAAIPLAMSCVAHLCGWAIREESVAEDSAAVKLLARVLGPALRRAKEEGQEAGHKADCLDNCHDRTEGEDGPIFGPEHQTNRECQRALTEGAEDIGRRAAINAYHVTLDALGAPADEWPCNRAKLLAERAREEGRQEERARAETLVKALVGTATGGSVSDPCWCCTLPAPLRKDGHTWLCSQARAALSQRSHER